MDERVPITSRAADDSKEKHEAFLRSLIPGYQFNAFPNRYTRRQAAKGAGYLRRDKEGNNAWHIYKATRNVQTISRITA